MQYSEETELAVKPEMKKAVITRELDKIRNAKGGEILAKDILDKAKSKNHPLHDEFEWDDKVAGHKYRLKQAYDMIRLYEAVVTHKESQRAPVIESGAAVRGLLQGYSGLPFRMRKEVMDDDSLRQGEIEKKVMVLRAWVRETIDIPELAGLRAIIEQGIEELSS